jgi:hypothetical protein
MKDTTPMPNHDPAPSADKLGSLVEAYLPALAANSQGAGA